MAAFSLIEMLVVFAIINVLLALVLPAVQAARETARNVMCRGRLNQLGLALHSYHDAHGTFPLANLPRRYWSWQAALLPFLECANIYDTINYNDGRSACWDALAADLREGRKPPSLAGLESFACPSDPLALTYRDIGVFSGVYGLHRFGSFLGVSGSRIDAPLPCSRLDASRDGMMYAHFIDDVNPFCSAYFPGVPMRLSLVLDGTSKTILVGERGVPRQDNNDYGWILCGTGYNVAGEGDHVLSVGGGFYFSTTLDLTDTGLPADPRHFWSYHPGGANFLFADGSVQKFEYSMSFPLLQSLATRNGGD